MHRLNDLEEPEVYLHDLFAVSTSLSFHRLAYVLSRVLIADAARLQAVLSVKGSITEEDVILLQLTPEERIILTRRSASFNKLRIKADYFLFVNRSNSTLSAKHAEHMQLLYADDISTIAVPRQPETWIKIDEVPQEI